MPCGFCSSACDVGYKITIRDNRNTAIYADFDVKIVSGVRKCGRRLNVG